MEILAGALVALLAFILGFVIGERTVKETQKPIMTFSRKTKPKIKPIVRDDSKAFEIENSR